MELLSEAGMCGLCILSFMLINYHQMQISESISMFEELAQLDTEGVEGTFYGTVEGRARFRKDESVQNKEEIAALIENAPATVDNLIQVPAILEDGEGGA